MLKSLRHYNFVTRTTINVGFMFGYTFWIMWKIKYAHRSCSANKTTVSYNRLAIRVGIDGSQQFYKENDRHILWFFSSNERFFMDKPCHTFFTWMNLNIFPSPIHDWKPNSMTEHVGIEKEWPSTVKVWFKDSAFTPQHVRILMYWQCIT